MNLSLQRLRTVVPVWAALTFVMTFFLYGTSPDMVGPQGITIFFAISYLFIAATIQVFVLLLLRVLARPGNLGRWRASYSLIAAFLPVTVVGLDSLDQLVLRDILIFVGLVGLIIFYVSKRGRNGTAA